VRPRPVRAATVLIVALAGCGAPASGPDVPERVFTGPLPSPLPQQPVNPRAAGPWPGFERDARHSSSLGVVGPQSAGIRWRRRLEGPVVPGPAVARGEVVYAASNAGVVHAIDLRTGRDRWRFDAGATYGSDLSTTAPAVLHDQTVLWPGPRDSLYALTPSGRLRWRVRYGSFVLSPLVGGDDTVYVAEMAGVLHALTLRRRGPPRERWALRLGAPTYASPSQASDATIYTTSGSDLVAVRDAGSDGRVRWRFRTGKLIEVSPAVAPDGTVVTGSNDRFQYGVSPDGRLRWRFDRRILTYSSPAVTPDGLAYFGDHRGIVTALDARNGRLLARYAALRLRPGGPSVGVWTAPAIDARHDVYFGTRAGHVYGFAVGGRRLFDIDTGATVDSYPALAGDGTLLIGSTSGLLYAISGRARSRGDPR